MNKKALLVVIVLGVLIVLAGVQAFQLTEIKNSMSDEGGSSLGSVSSAPRTQRVASPSPSSYGMVGGC